MRLLLTAPWQLFVRPKRALAARNTGQPADFWLSFAFAMSTLFLLPPLFCLALGSPQSLYGYGVSTLFALQFGILHTAAVYLTWAILGSRPPIARFAVTQFYVLAMLRIIPTALSLGEAGLQSLNRGFAGEALGESAELATWTSRLAGGDFDTWVSLAKPVVLGVWMIAAWGAYRQLTGVSRARSTLAFLAFLMSLGWMNKETQPYLRDATRPSRAAAAAMADPTTVYEHVGVTVNDATLAGDDAFSVIEPVWWAADVDDSYEAYEWSLRHFSRSQRLLVALHWYLDEVNSGGHEGFFRGDAGMTAFDVAEAFMELKLPEGAAIVRDATGRFGNFVWNRALRREQLERRKLAFDDLDTRFQDLQKTIDLNDAMLRFARSHAADFYFEGTIDRIADPEEEPSSRPDGGDRASTRSGVASR